jgi:hypothetical protein
MAAAHRRFPGALILALGVLLGWSMDHLPNSRSIVLAQARGAVPPPPAEPVVLPGESIVASGPVEIRYNEGIKVQIPLDALYYLDYGRAWLWATVPSFQKSVGPAKVIDKFAVRDLLADFRIDTARVPNAKFRMTTGSLGTYSDGWAPLYVFETVTNQVAVYRVSQQSVGRVTTPRFELLEITSIDARAAGVGVR